MRPWASVCMRSGVGALSGRRSCRFRMVMARLGACWSYVARDQRPAALGNARPGLDFDGVVQRYSTVARPQLTRGFGNLGQLARAGHEQPWLAHRLTAQAEQLERQLVDRRRRQPIGQIELAFERAP